MEVSTGAGTLLATLRKALLVGASLLPITAAAAYGGPALAAKPNNQACLGTDFSTYARYGSEISASGAGFGQFDAALAQSVPGLGLPIQFHQAGLIPDSYVENSCNNP